ncbi:unnamed protein product, partial [Mesorhabditis spiculigera]
MDLTSSSSSEPDVKTTPARRRDLLSKFFTVGKEEQKCLLAKMWTEKSAFLQMESIDTHFDRLELIVQGNVRTTDFAACKRCGTIMNFAKRGGHHRRHTITCGMVMNNPLPQKHDTARGAAKYTKDGLRTRIGEYLLKTAQSFSHAEEPEFRQLLQYAAEFGKRTGDTIPDAHFPNRRHISSHAEENYQKQLEQACPQLLRAAQEKRLAILADHGHFFDDYLSVFATYCNEDMQTKLVPLALKAVSKPENARELFDSLVDCVTAIGLQASDLENAPLTADGAAVMQVVGNTYLEEIRFTIFYGK